MFNGTIYGCSVYPREVVIKALEVNTSAVVFCHNHPCGNCEPSKADIYITVKLKAALDLLDIRTLDHIIVAGRTCVSLAERNLL